MSMLPLRRNIQSSLGTYHYVFAALIIGILVAFNHWAMSQMIRAQEQHVSLSELGSKQRILFQEAGTSARAIMAELNSEEGNNDFLIKGIQAQLKETAHRLIETHRDILYYASHQPFYFIETVNINEYYFNEPYRLDPRITGFIQQILQLANNDSNSLKTRYMRWTPVDIAVAKDGLLIRGFDEVMTNLNTNLIEHTNFLKVGLDVLNGLIILTILLEALFIFRPLILRRNQYQQELIQSRERYEMLAHHDVLTELANREFLIKESQTLIEKYTLENRGFFLSVIDLDGFKTINDTYGHRAGDEVLKVVANRLRESLRDQDIIVRLGGDEFTFIVTEFESKEILETLANRIINKINKPIIDEGKEFNVGASLGGAFFPTDATTLDGLLSKADSAMYHSKKMGKNRLTIYRQKGSSKLLNQDSFEKAMKKKEFIVYYQPKINLYDSSHVGFEALLRWHHPECGIVEPGEFIHYAEETGLIKPLTHYVFKQAHQCYQYWQGSQLMPGRIAINIPEDLISIDATKNEFWQTVIATQGIADWLDVEVTENVFVNRNYAMIKNNFDLLRKNGIEIHLDDFGTGYASLSHLKDMPINALKLDHSFVAEILIDEKVQMITQAIAQLGVNMNKKVIAEGVETQAQLNALKEINCTQAQGFLVSHPLPPEQTMHYLSFQHAAHKKVLGKTDGINR